MIKAEPVKIKPVEARAMVLDVLRKHNYTGRTTEIAEWTQLASLRGPPCGADVGRRR
jgi:hypothetical protein